MGRGDRARGGMPPEPDLPPLSKNQVEVIVESRARSVQIRTRNYTPGLYARELTDFTLDLDAEGVRLLTNALADAHAAHVEGKASEVVVVRGR